ncbi:MAG TPA: hypothetical protein VKP14_10150 [Gaiellaceae bacterium]|nr:hypothetical protein [Gaiellaceae bacterium]
MSVTLRKQIDTSRWEAPLRDAARRAGDLTPVHRQIGELLTNVVHRNFDSNGNGRWPDLSVSTLIARARGRTGTAKVFKQARKGVESRALTKHAQTIIEGAKALIWSGRLYRSITYLADRAFVEVGSNLKQAARLFFGSGPGVRPATPARNPFELLPGDEQTIMELYRIYLTGGLT